MKRKVGFLTDVPDIKKKALIKIFTDKNYTLLQQFIFEKALSYEEPQRKGTSKGDPIGFSRNKYSASLYMLTNQKKKDMAKMLKISYGLLRKWGTEKEFKELMISHICEFISILNVYIFLRIGALQEANEELIKKPVRELIKIDPGEFYLQKLDEYDMSFNKLSDVKNYNDTLVNLFFAYLIEYMEKTLPKEADDDLMFAFKQHVYHIVSYIQIQKGISSEKEIKEKDEQINNRLRNDIVDGVINILEKAKITEKDRKQAIIGLHSLKQKT